MKLTILSVQDFFHKLTEFKSCTATPSGHTESACQHFGGDAWNPKVKFRSFSTELFYGN